MRGSSGLIEGAHAGHGLGHQFLRHVERTKVLLHLVDVSSLSGRDPVEDFDVLCRELGLYNPAMLEKLVYKVLLVVTLKQFVEGSIDKARKDLQEFSHQPILDALKKHPDGVSLDAFWGVQDDGAKLWKAREVARAMEDSNAIVYRMKTDQYQPFR